MHIILVAFGDNYQRMNDTSGTVKVTRMANTVGQKIILFSGSQRAEGGGTPW